MRRWLSRTFNHLIYVRLFLYKEFKLGPFNGIDVRAYRKPSSHTISHVILERTSSGAKTSFADTYPTWSFDPHGPKWRAIVENSRLACPSEIPKSVSYGIYGRSVSYDQDGDFFSEDFDGEIFSIRRQCVIEIELEIAANENRKE